MLKYFITTFFIISNAFAIDCPQKGKTVVCHAGSEINPNFVNICVDFGSLWGHFAHHSKDSYGECPVQASKPYACNAGIKHETPPNNICKDLTTGDYVENCDGLISCMCSYGGDTQNRTDFMNFTYKNRENEQENKRVTGADIDTFATAFTNQEFGKYEILSESLTFNFGSERLGAEYFVDLCVERPTSSQDYAQVSALLILDGNILRRSPYIGQSQLMLKSSLFCTNDLSEPWKVYNQLVYNNSYSPYPFSGAHLNHYSPKSNLCVHRYTFLEEVNVPYLRDWEHSNVKASITIDTLEEDNNDGPIQICHVQKLRGNNYQCTNMNFPSSENYIDYILTYNNVSDWRQDHNHDYRGQCLSPCGPLQGNISF